MTIRKYYVILTVLLCLITTLWKGPRTAALSYVASDLNTVSTGGVQTSTESHIPSTMGGEMPVPHHAVDPLSLNRVVYHGMFGLGHRMGKMSSAYHLATRFRDEAQVPLVMHANWGQCETTEEDAGGAIFEYLFGDPILLLPGDASPQPVAQPRAIRIVNDGAMYYGGQKMKDARIPIALSETIDTPESPFFNKMASDVHFFNLLFSRFEVIHPEPKDFRERHKFGDHTVIGLHIRAGNGETAHFQEAGREVEVEEDVFLGRLEILIKHLVDHLQQLSTTNTKPLLLFFATDTPTMIHNIKTMATNTWHIPVVNYEQPAIPKGEGVSFAKLKTGHECLEGWKNMLVDNILLSHSNVLVAAMRSSFTQGPPMTLVFHRNKGNGPSRDPHFCEVSDTGDAMTCLNNRQDWLFRRNPENEVTWSSVGVARPHSWIDLNVYHFPDRHEDPRSQREYQNAINFLKGLNPTITLLPFGERFSQKYRNMPKNRTLEWTYK